MIFNIVSGVKYNCVACLFIVTYITDFNTLHLMANPFSYTSWDIFVMYKTLLRKLDYRYQFFHEIEFNRYY